MQNKKIKISYDESEETKRYMEKMNYNQSKWIRTATKSLMNKELKKLSPGRPQNLLRDI